MLVAVGDVHGRADLYEAMLAALADDVRRLEPASVLSAQLGDLIDRGPNSLDCLSLAAAGLSDFLDPGAAVEDVVLMGNHDDWLRMALDDTLGPSDVSTWVNNGGNETFADFGIIYRGNVAELAAELRDRTPAPLAAFIRSLGFKRHEGQIILAHAGLDPRKPMEEQGRAECLWIRGAFLDAEPWPFESIVVHGHTIEMRHPEEPKVHPHRIGIDSGAFGSGVLTAVEFQGSRMRFLQAIAE